MVEKVKIVKENGADFLIEDLETGKQYLIDKTYFGRRYTPENPLPIHTELWEKLEAQAEELYKVKRNNIKLRKELKRERRKRGKEQKEKPEVQHLRKGQKRGRHGRNG
jgi:hypothetical protein